MRIGASFSGPPHVRHVVRALLGASLLLAAPPSNPAAAQDLNGFTPERGQGTVALSVTTESFDRFWVGTRKVEDPGIGRYRTDSAALWMTYGITERLALVANVPYVEVDGDGPANFTDGAAQDLSLLITARLASSGDARHGLLASAGLRTPMSDYEADQPVAVGDGTTDALLRLVYQFATGPWYLSQQVGFDLRGEDAPDGFPLYTEVGRSLGRFTVSLFHLLAIADGGTDIGDPGFTFPSNQEEVQRAGAKLYARVSDRWGLAVAGFTTVDGRNTGDSDGVSAALVAGF